MSENRARLASLVLIAQICGAALMAAPPASAQDALTPGSFKAYAAEGVEARVSNFSGLPVPRYSSLRFDKVNGRAGPSRDYPVEWTYERAGLPVVIVRESEDWRKIRDPMGDEVWVSKNQLAGERTVMTTDHGAIRRSAQANAPMTARFAPGTVLALGDCAGAWCRVEGAGRKGWALKSQLWGADALPAATHR